MKKNTKKSNLTVVSKATIMLGYNDVVHGFKGKQEYYHDEWFNFEEGAWNLAVETANGRYGDQIYIQGGLDKTEDAIALIDSFDKEIGQAMIYVGSLKSARTQWLLAIVNKVREKSPGCVFLFFVCDCAKDKTREIKRLMKETNTSHQNWFAQSHTGGDPYFESGAANIGNNTMWYYAMVCRRYGQENMEYGLQLHQMRNWGDSEKQEHRFIAMETGDWILKI